MLVHLMVGREAEKLVLNEVTTVAGNDLERATELARKMVCEWGMSERLGPLTFGKKDEEIFLGREISRAREYSEKTAQLIDDEIKRIVTNAADKARAILTEHIDALHRIAQALLERETLDGNELDELIREAASTGDSSNGKPRRRTRRKKAADDARASEEVKAEKDNPADEE